MGFYPLLLTPWVILTNWPAQNLPSNILQLYVVYYGALHPPPSPPIKTNKQNTSTNTQKITKPQNNNKRKNIAEWNKLKNEDVLCFDANNNVKQYTHPRSSQGEGEWGGRLRAIDDNLVGVDSSFALGVLLGFGYGAPREIHARGQRSGVAAVTSTFKYKRYIQLQAPPLV
jgi:hypothetical protein